MITPYGDWSTYPEVEHMLSNVRKLVVGHPVRNQVAVEAIQLSTAISLKRIADSLDFIADIMRNR